MIGIFAFGAAKLRDLNRTSIQAHFRAPTVIPAEARVIVDARLREHDVALV